MMNFLARLELFGNFWNSGILGIFFYCCKSKTTLYKWQDAVAADAAGLPSSESRFVAVHPRAAVPATGVAGSPQEPNRANLASPGTKNPDVAVE